MTQSGSFIVYPSVTACNICKKLLLDVDYREHRIQHVNEHVGQFFRGWKRREPDQFTQDNDGA